jgi:hypothetical protein
MSSRDDGPAEPASRGPGWGTELLSRLSAGPVLPRRVALVIMTALALLVWAAIIGGVWLIFR